MKRVLEIILGTAIVGGAIAFGGVQPLAYSLMEVAIFTAVLLALIQQARSGQIKFPLPLWPALFVLLVTFQILPLPAWLVRVLSPKRFLSLPLAAQSGSGPSWITLSIYPHDTEVALLKLLAYLGVFLLAAYLFDSGTRKSLLVRILIGLGCAEAIYGTFQYLTHTEKILWYKKIYYLGLATGTYINHNHFAGLLEMAGPFVVASVYGAYQYHAGQDSRRRPRRSSGADVPAARLLFWAFLMLIIVMGVIFSVSRGGIIATLLSIMFMGLLTAFRTRRKAWVTGLLVFLLCMVGYGVWIGLGPVIGRFEEIRETNYLQMEGRLSFWRDSYRIITEYPLTGTGWGTFGVAFRGYQSTWVDTFVDHPHNDYIEVATDTGLVGAVLLWVPILFLFGKMVYSFATDYRRFRSVVTLGCAGSTLALLLHSLTDFNLQIPANAMVFAMVLGIGYKASCLERKGEDAAKVQAPARAAKEFARQVRGFV
ncbi:MAG: O-antigen ligase family protein [Acidobacteriia bacterium]|nr:O-antigen ligase family protein [Terriglobia bacterium]